MQSTQSLSRALRRAPAHSGALRCPSALPEHQPVLSALPGRRPALSITAPPRRQPTSSAFLGISRASARLFRTHQRRPIFSAPTSDGPSSPGPQRFPDVGPPSRPHRFPSVAPSFPRSSALPEHRPRPPKPAASQRQGIAISLSVFYRSDRSGGDTGTIRGIFDLARGISSAFFAVLPSQLAKTVQYRRKIPKR